MEQEIKQENNQEVDQELEQETEQKVEQKVEQKKLSKKAIVIMIASVCVVALIIVGIIVFLNRGYRIITVVDVEGTVNVQHAKDEPIDAYEGMNLQNKDSISTKADSTAMLQFDSEKYVEVMPETTIAIVAKGREDKQTTRTTIILEEGSISNEINTHLGEKENFDIETPSVCMGIRGTKFIVRTFEEDVKKTYIEVTEGAVEAYREGEEESCKIEAGYHATISETDQLSDISVDENIPYFEFAFSLDDISFSGMSVEELSYDKIAGALGINKERYGENTQTAIGVGMYLDHNPLLFSDDFKWQYFVDGPDIMYEFGDGEYFGVYSEGNGKRLSCQLGKDPGAAEYIYPIIPIDIGVDELKTMMHVDQLEEALGEEQECIIECNWSDHQFKLSRNGNDYYSFAEMNTNRVFTFNAAEGDCAWSMSYKNEINE